MQSKIIKDSEAVQMELSTEQMKVVNSLKRHIARSKGSYALYFVESNLSQVTYRLISELAQQNDLNLLHLDIKDYIDEDRQKKGNSLHIDEWIDKQRQIHQSNFPKKPIDGINLTGMEYLLPTDAKKKVVKTVSELNWRRNYFQQLAQPLIIWVPSYALEIIANQASDFYDWYSDVLVVHADASQHKQAYDVQIQAMRHPASGIHASLYQDSQNKNQQLSTLMALLKDSRNSKDQSYLYNEMGLVAKSMGDLNNALVYHQQALTIDEQLGDQAGMGTKLNNIATIYHARGDYTQALAYLQRALTIAEQLGDQAGMGARLNNIAAIYHARGDYTQALDHLKRALTIAEQLGDQKGMGAKLNNISQIYGARGDYTQALDCLKQSLKIYEAIGDQAGLAYSHYNLFRLYFDMGSQDLAMPHRQQAKQIAQSIGLKDILDKFDG